MNVGGVPYRTIWLAEDGVGVQVIDQTRLPHEFVTRRLDTAQDAAEAIRTMVVRGAPLIGAAAAYGLALQARHDASDDALQRAYTVLLASRPTAVNLRWALDEVMRAVSGVEAPDRAEIAYRTAGALCEDDVATCAAIGRHGLELIARAWRELPEHRPVNILTHCNAGWLATVDWGTALAPIYRAHDSGIDVHVWVRETRPRNQGASLTAWELGSHGVPHTVVADNAGGHLLQKGLVDLCITGTDRTLTTGDVCNKIGTYMLALAAQDCGVPFYVALPHSTIDWSTEDPAAIPIEERAPHEITHVRGRAADGSITEVRVAPADTPAVNPAFDVTPARLVSALITDRGVCDASREGLLALFPERST